MAWRWSAPRGSTNVSSILSWASWQSIFLLLHHRGQRPPGPGFSRTSEPTGRLYFRTGPADVRWLAGSGAPAATVGRLHPFQNLILAILSLRCTGKSFSFAQPQRAPREYKWPEARMSIW